MFKKIKDLDIAFSNDRLCIQLLGIIAEKKPLDCLTCGIWGFVAPQAVESRVTRPVALDNPSLPQKLPWLQSMQSDDCYGHGTNVFSIKLVEFFYGFLILVNCEIKLDKSKNYHLCHFDKYLIYLLLNKFITEFFSWPLLMTKSVRNAHAQAPGLSHLCVCPGRSRWALVGSDTLTPAQEDVFRM